MAVRYYILYVVSANTDVLYIKKKPLKYTIMELNNVKVTRFYPYESVHLLNCFLETETSEE